MTNDDEITTKKAVITTALIDGKDWDGTYNLLEAHFRQHDAKKVREAIYNLIIRLESDCEDYGYNLALIDAEEAIMEELGVSDES